MKTLGITSVRLLNWYYMPDFSLPEIRLVLFFFFIAQLVKNLAFGWERPQEGFLGQEDSGEGRLPHPDILGHPQAQREANNVPAMEDLGLNPLARKIPS